MEDYSLKCISPIDGRYNNKCLELVNYFSEYALIKYRTRVEIDYFIKLCKYLPELSKIDINLYENQLKNIHKNMDVSKIKKIESVINHDVKSIEYYLKDIFVSVFKTDKYNNFIHFGLTSQDINNTAVPLSVLEFNSDIFLPNLLKLMKKF